MDCLTGDRILYYKDNKILINKNNEINIYYEDGHKHFIENVYIDSMINKVIVNNNKVFCITTDGEVYLYGDNKYGEMGIDPNKGYIRKPYKINIDKQVIDIISFEYSTYFKTIDNRYYACGRNLHGSLGIDSNTFKIIIPTEVVIDKEIKEIKEIREYEYTATYFTTIDNDIYACGCNVAGCLGVGSTDNEILSPVKIQLDEPIRKILHFQNYINFYMTTENNCYASGFNHYGQLGVNIYDKCINIPTKVNINEPISQIIRKHLSTITYFISLNGELYIAGKNEYTYRYELFSYIKKIYSPLYIKRTECLELIYDDIENCNRQSCLELIFN